MAKEHNTTERSFAIAPLYNKYLDFVVNTTYGNYNRKALDVLTRKHTEFHKFHALLVAPYNHRPSFNITTKHEDNYIEINVLIEAYNIAQKARNDTRRAHVRHS